jgi:hypothetical protein
VTTPWWAALPPVTARVACGSGTHRLRWKDGKLTADDHSGAEAELALGGTEPGCVELIRRWDARSDDLDVLAIGPRGQKDRLRLLAEEREALSELTRPPPPRPSAAPGTELVASADEPGGALRIARRHQARRHWRPDPVAEHRIELLQLLALGLGFQLRLSATVAAAWSGKPVSPDAESVLTAALAARFAPAAADWLGADPDLVSVIRHEGPGWGELARTGDEISAALPLIWLARIWAAGLAVVEGRLVVDVTEVTWPAAVVLAIREPGQEPERLSVAYRDRRWSAVT